MYGFWFGFAWLWFTPSFLWLGFVYICPSRRVLSLHGNGSFETFCLEPGAGILIDHWLGW
jgi:hypothetical protein